MYVCWHFFVEIFVILYKYYLYLNLRILKEVKNEREHDIKITHVRKMHITKKFKANKKETRDIGTLLISHY